MHDSAFGYFITACVVISLAMASYALLPRLVRSERLEKTEAVDLKL